MKTNNSEPNQKPKVLLAMSGGVDSSVAALLLKKQGYEVIGAFMKNWSDTKNPLTGECNWREERRIATQIASLLDIPLITLDFEKQYKRDVVEEMFKLYKKGITPNPDVDCNNKVKFPLLGKEAQKRKISLIATGHYVRIKRIINGKAVDDKKFLKLIDNKNSNIKNVNIKDIKNNASLRAQFKLLRSKDESKDQSYFLYRLTQNDLSHTLFPIGELTKSQVREIAQKNNFPNYNKKSTTGICFIGKINLKDFLKQKIPLKKGNILDPQGKIIGQHDGIYYYTIGQRLGPRYGFEISKKSDNPQTLKRWYVAKKDLKTNTIIAAPENHPLLFKKEIIIHNFYLISNQKKEVIKKLMNKQVNVRIRHVGELLSSTIKKEKNKIKVILKTPITGISEGQAIVIYKKDSSECLGGGVIGF